MSENHHVSAPAEVAAGTAEAAWNKVREEARALSAGRVISQLLSAVDEYGEACANRAGAQVIKKAPLVVTLENVNMGQQWRATSNYSPRISCVYGDTPQQALSMALVDAGHVAPSAQADAPVPSDADIEALRDAFDWEGWTCPKAAQRAFARAVLARWSTAPSAPTQEAAQPAAGQGDAARSIELTDDVRFILGFICFQCMFIVQALRLGGREINNKAEDEQAAAIHFMLNHYLADRENWRENVNAELRTMAAKGQEGGTHG